MKIADLIARLEAVAAVNPKAEVRMYQQPNYPIEYGIFGVYVDTEGGVAYIVEGNHIGYGSSLDNFDEVEA